MKRLCGLMIFIVGLILSAAAWCQDALPTPDSPVTSGILRVAADFVLNPWVTASLVVIGMALIISEIVSIGSWGLTGISGTLCLGAVTGAGLVTGAGWMGAALLLVGLVLMMVESKVLPGRVVPGIAGLSCLFLGLYGLLAAGTVGTIYAASLSAVFALLAAVAFIVHLPTNPAWRVAGRQVHMSEKRSAVGALNHGHATITKIPRDTSDHQSDDDQTTISH